jgi:Protein of unknown function (DUF3105)
VANKKPRTPPPPRRVQAPQQRNADDMGRQHRTALYAISGAGIVGLVAVIIAIAAFGGSGSNKVNDKQVASAMAAAGCTFKTVDGFLPPGQNMHTADLNKSPMPWNTSPPSNGQHYYQWAVWGFYTKPINPRMVVHNEEHGGVIAWWGSGVPQSTVAQLKAWYDEEPTGSFGTPYPSLGTKIAITAWTGDTNRYQRNGYYGQGHIAVCPSYTDATKKAFESFRKAYRGKGPEGIPLSSDAPGLGP